MHEFGVAEGLLTAVLNSARQNDAERVLKVRMRIGHLAGIVSESLTFAFEALAQGTLADGATLSIDEVPVTCHCSPCDLDFECRPGFYRCPACDTPSSEIRSGRELDVIDMEVA